MSSEALAQRLSLEIGDLARSLSAAGPIGDHAMRLLESAAVAAMHAVSLEELRHERPRGADAAAMRSLGRAA